MEFVLSVSLQEVFGTHEVNSHTVSDSRMELEWNNTISPFFVGTLKRSRGAPCSVSLRVGSFFVITTLHYNYIPVSAGLIVQFNVSAVCFCSYVKRLSTCDRPTLMCSLYFIMTHCLSIAALCFPLTGLRFDQQTGRWQASSNLLNLLEPHPVHCSVLCVLFLVFFPLFACLFSWRGWEGLRHRWETLHYRERLRLVSLIFH